MKKSMSREEWDSSAGDYENVRKRSTQEESGVSHQVFSSKWKLKLLSIPSSRKVRGMMHVKKLVYFSITMWFHLM